MAVRYNAKSGRGGPDYDFSAPIVKEPIPVTEFDQLAYNGAYNQIPNETGIYKSKLPMQEIIPTGGGKHSGRTGPLK